MSVEIIVVRVIWSYDKYLNTYIDKNGAWITDKKNNQDHADNWITMIMYFENNVKKYEV